MERVTMFVPTYQGLSATDFLRSTAARAECFPFNAPHAVRFYRARNAIYHLFKALRAQRRTLTVLAPDYYSGNEILAMRAAGATIHYCPVDRQMRLDPDEVERLCVRHSPDLLYVIHYLGWAQPMTALADICRRRGMLLFEDCALALLSDLDGQPLGSFGDWSVFCLYKTLPVPNGAVLVQNTAALESLERLPLRHGGSASVAGRTAELLVQRTRSRAQGLGTALYAMKRGLGRAAGALDVHRTPVGDMGFDVADVDLAMSRLSERVLARQDFAEIRRRRLANFRHLASALDGRASQVLPDPADGVCPLFFPVFVPDKAAAAAALQRRGVDALEFWNEGVADDDLHASPHVRFLRRHVLELPIHQDLTPEHVDYVAREVAALNLRMAA
jgi:dTDP-4-amino-4,6-dideoxygalactose transaminase